MKRSDIYRSKIAAGNHVNNCARFWRTASAKTRKKKDSHLALGLHQAGLQEALVVEVTIDGDTSGVITAVLQPGETVEENIANLLALLGNQMVQVSENPAHGESS